jgi:hypothetical protein
VVELLQKNQNTFEDDPYGFGCFVKDNNGNNIDYIDYRSVYPFSNSRLDARHIVESTPTSAKFIDPKDQTTFTVTWNQSEDPDYCCGTGLTGTIGPKGADPDNPNQNPSTYEGDIVFSDWEFSSIPVPDISELF